jgi:hypothetical protein
LEIGAVGNVECNVRAVNCVTSNWAGSATIKQAVTNNDQGRGIMEARSIPSKKQDNTQLGRLTMRFAQLSTAG